MDPVNFVLKNGAKLAAFQGQFVLCYNNEHKTCPLVKFCIDFWSLMHISFFCEMERFSGIIYCLIVSISRFFASDFE